MTNRAVEFVNDGGDVRWQPALSDGRRLYAVSEHTAVIDDFYGGYVSFPKWRKPNQADIMDKPVLYRYRRTAEKISYRKEKTDREKERKLLKTKRKTDFREEK